MVLPIRMFQKWLPLDIILIYSPPKSLEYLLVYNKLTLLLLEANRNNSVTNSGYSSQNHMKMTYHLAFYSL